MVLILPCLLKSNNRVKLHFLVLDRCPLFFLFVKAGGSVKLKTLEINAGQSGMVLPFTPAGVSFKSIYYKVPMPVGADGESYLEVPAPLCSLIMWSLVLI